MTNRPCFSLPHPPPSDPPPWPGKDGPNTTTTNFELISPSPMFQFWAILEINLASQAPPNFWEVPGLPRKFPGLPRKFFGDFPGSSLTVELNSFPDVPRKFPRLPRKFPGLPRKFPGLPRRSAPFSGKPDTLSWLTKTFSGLSRMPDQAPCPVYTKENTQGK